MAKIVIGALASQLTVVQTVLQLDPVRPCSSKPASSYHDDHYGVEYDAADGERSRVRGPDSAYKAVY